MRFRSAWTRGLCYGGIFAAAMGVIPVIVAIFGSGPLSEMVLAAGVSVLGWGVIGFLAGYASHGEQKADAADQPAQAGDVSLFRRLLYRFVAGMLLSYIASAVVCGIMFLSMSALEGFEGTQKRRPSAEERRLVFSVLCGFIGMTSGAFTGCWLGAMLARGGNVLRPIAKFAFVAAILGTLSGGWLGALVGTANMRFFEMNDWTGIAAAIAGGVAGIASAIFLRTRGFR